MTDAPPIPLADVPLTLNNNLLYVAVQIGDVPCICLLDTGAQTSVLDQTIATQLDLVASGQVEGGGAGAGTFSVSFAPQVTAELGPLSFTLTQVAVAPIRGLLEPYVGRHVDGILGFDFFSQFVLHVDPTASQLKVFSPHAFTPSAESFSLPLTLQNNHPHVRARLQWTDALAAEVDLIIDTGAADTLYLSTSFVDTHNLLQQLQQTTNGFVVGVGGMSHTPVGRIEALTVGALRLDDLYVYCSQDQAGGFAGLLGADGVLGGEVLRRFVSVWDYPNGYLHLTPLPEATAPYRFDTAGLLLMAPPPGFTERQIADVLPGSPADLAGLQAGDEILAINDDPASDWSLQDLYQGFRHPNTYRLQLRRGQATRAILLETETRI